jgi:hypothetical protein
MDIIIMKFFEKAEFKSLIFNNECDNIGLIDYSGQDHLTRYRVK